MDFIKYADEYGEIPNPYAGKLDTGRGTEWVDGTISAEFLQEHFGHCETLDECIASTNSEGLKRFFEHLKAQQ